jgi:hypothetical protein
MLIVFQVALLNLTPAPEGATYAWSKFIVHDGVTDQYAEPESQSLL